VDLTIGSIVYVFQPETSEEVPRWAKTKVVKISNTGSWFRTKKKVMFDDGMHMYEFMMNDYLITWAREPLSTDLKAHNVNWNNRFKRKRVDVELQSEISVSI